MLIWCVNQSRGMIQFLRLFLSAPMSLEEGGGSTCPAPLASTTSLLPWPPSEMPIGSLASSDEGGGEANPAVPSRFSSLSTLLALSCGHGRWPDQRRRRLDLWLICCRSLWCAAAVAWRWWWQRQQLVRVSSLAATLASPLRSSWLLGEGSCGPSLPVRGSLRCFGDFMVAWPAVACSVACQRRGGGVTGGVVGSTSRHLHLSSAPGVCLDV